MKDGGAGSRWGRAWAWFTAPPDEALADAARDSELRVARVRLWLTLLLTLIPTVSLTISGGETQDFIGLAAALLAVSAAVLLARIVERGVYRPSVSFASAVVDVSLVTMALFAFWVMKLPIIATNSRVIFECYFLAIASSALRYDRRVTLMAGLAAIVQYLGLSALVWVTHRHDHLLWGNEHYGDFDWMTQISRTVVLLGMTVVALAIVARSQRLRAMSTGDRLTGLFNRAYAEEFLINEVLRTTRSGSALVLAMLDVDHFKRYNDTYGHAAGDAALKKIALVIRSALRRSDVVARFGGEEILIALPATTLEAGLEKLEEIRVKLGLTDIRLPKGGTARVTVSIGAASFGRDGTAVDTLLDVADARLYVAKAAGRNRVVGNDT